MKNKDGLILAGVVAAIYVARKMQNKVEGIGKINNSVLNEYIIDSIQPDGYNVNPKTVKDKLQFLADTFNSEYGHMIKRVGYQNAFKEWISGAPSSFAIDHEYYEIIKLAKKMGSIPNNATSKQEDKIILNYYNFMAAKTLMLMRKYKINL